MKDLKGFIHREFWKYTHLIVPTNPITLRDIPKLKSTNTNGRVKSWHNPNFKSGYKGVRK